MRTSRWALRIAASLVVAAGILLGAARLLAFVQPVRDAADVVLYGQTFDRAGKAVARAGDVNGDGYADFLVGAPWAVPEGGERVGRVYLLLGRADLAAPDGELLLENADASFLGEFLNAETGQAVAGAGDVNGDGLDDFLIGARKASPPGDLASAGKTYLLLGRAGADWGQDFDLAGADASFIGDAAGDGAGGSLAGARDVNGDGLRDFVIGAPYADGMQEGSGKASLFLGREDADWGQDVRLADADASFLGVWNGDYTGLDVAGLGDVNGDGLDDISIGAHGSDTDGSSAGTAYLVFGRAAADWGAAFDLTDADVRFASEAASSFTGRSVSGVGDANGDGLADVLIGAPGIDSPATDCGKVYLVLGREDDSWGSPVSLADADASWVGVVEGEEVGTATGLAGDVNGDGLGDLVFGSEDNQGGGPDGSGRVYLVVGRPSGWSRDVSLAGADTAIDISVLEGAFLQDEFGTAASGAGDVDGDGFHDLVVGAAGFNDAYDHHGVAFLLRGRGLAFDKRSVAPLVPAGGTASFQMRFTNTMRTTVHGALVVDQLPQGVGFVSCSGGSNCVQQGRRVVWTVSDLAPQQADVVGLSVLVPDGVQSGARITNTAWITAPGLIAPVHDRAIVFVGAEQPTPTATASRTATRTPTRTPTYTPTRTATGPATTPGTPGTSGTPGAPATATASPTPDATVVTATRTAVPSGTATTPPTALATATATATPPTATPTPRASVFLPSLLKRVDASDPLLPEEYSVLRAVILANFAHPAIERLVISDDTDNWWLDDARAFEDRVAEYWPDVPEEAIAELITRNANQYPMSDRFGLDTEVVLISDDEAEEIFRRPDGWEELYRRYPGAQGMMGLSRVGFSCDGRWALAYMGNQFDWLAGHGDLYLLERVEDQWTVVDSIFLWIS